MPAEARRRCGPVRSCKCPGPGCGVRLLILRSWSAPCTGGAGDQFGRFGRCTLLGDQTFEDASRLHAAGIDIQLEQLPLWVGQQVGLLLFEHLQIFTEDLALAFADAVGEFLIFGLEAARHAPEVPDRGLGFRGYEVDHDARRLVGRGCVITALANMGHADLDQYMARRGEATDLPAVHRNVVVQAVAAQGHAPERRRHDVLHMPAGDHVVALNRGHWRDLVDLLLADARCMHIGLVGQVHQVVNHQAVVAVDVEQTAAIGPVRAVGPFQVMDQRRVGLLGIARPDPDKAVTLFYRIAADAREATHTLARHGLGFAVGAHGQAVIAADQLAVLDETQGQGRAPVRAEILDRRDLALLSAVEGDFLPADLSAQGFFGDLIWGAGYIPGVFREHGGSPESAFACFNWIQWSAQRRMVVKVKV